MKPINFSAMCAFLLLLTVSLSGCEAIAGIFKAGMWTGVIVIVAVIALVLYLVGKTKK